LDESAILVLSDGSIFFGKSIGATGTTVGEVVFNTSITGYQEILTDPSYLRQIVTLTYPHVGNTGVNSWDKESYSIKVSGLVVKNLPSIHSSWRADGSLRNYLKESGIIAISDIDTRRLTRIIRDKGALSGCISSLDLPVDSLISRAERAPSLAGQDLASVASTKTTYVWEKGSTGLSGKETDIVQRRYTVVAYDFGIKENILRLLVDRGCSVVVVPGNTGISEVLSHNPDGIFFSNGPGDPDPCDYAIEAIRELAKLAIPMFGICLGYQLMAIAFGGCTKKMKFGHHGANHPVRDLRTGKIFITSQNHGFIVEEKSLPQILEITHRSNFDGTLQGFKHKNLPAIGFQGHPEASPGPHDLKELFDQFVGFFEAHVKQHG